MRFIVNVLFFVILCILCTHWKRFWEGVHRLQQTARGTCSKQRSKQTQKRGGMIKNLYSRVKSNKWNSNLIKSVWLQGFTRSSLVAHLVKNLPAIQETWVQSLGQEDPLENEMPAHSNILPWRIPWMRSQVGYSPWGHKELDITKRLTLILKKKKKSYLASVFSCGKWV